MSSATAIGSDEIRTAYNGGELRNLIDQARAANRLSELDAQIETLSALYAEHPTSYELESIMGTFTNRAIAKAQRPSEQEKADAKAHHFLALGEYKALAAYTDADWFELLGAEVGLMCPSVPGRDPHALRSYLVRQGFWAWTCTLCKTTGNLRPIALERYRDSRDDR